MIPIALYTAQKLEDTHPSDESVQLLMYNAADELRAQHEAINRLKNENATLKDALTNLLDVFDRCEAGFPPEAELRFLARDLAKTALPPKLTTLNQTMILDEHGSGTMKWQPIETAPRNGTTILLRGKQAIADGWFGGLTGAGWVWPYIYAEPLYWMPLPEAPNVEVTGAARLYRAASVLTAGLCLITVPNFLNFAVIFIPELRVHLDFRCTLFQQGDSGIPAIGQEVREAFFIFELVETSFSILFMAFAFTCFNFRPMTLE